MLAQRLKKLRENRKMTQKNLAEKIGISASTIAGWETGDRHPDHEMLIKLADFFDVSVDSLLGRCDFDVKIDVDAERVKFKSGIEKTRDEVWASFDKALTEGSLTEEQAEIGLKIIQQTMELLIESNKSK